MTKFSFEQKPWNTHVSTVMQKYSFRKRTRADILADITDKQMTAWEAWANEADKRAEDTLAPVLARREAFMTQVEEIWPSTYDKRWKKVRSKEYNLILKRLRDASTAPYYVPDGWRKGYYARQFKDFKNEVERARKEVAMEKKREEGKQRAMQEAIERAQKTAVIAVRYGLDATASHDTVFDHLMEQNKYLPIVIWGIAARNDFEYCDTVMARVRKMPIENDMDKEICDAYLLNGEDFDGWGVDGRVFRDMEWGYNDDRWDDLIPAQLRKDATYLLHILFF